MCACSSVRIYGFMTRSITNFSYLFIQIDVAHVYDALMDMIGDESLQKPTRYVYVWLKQYQQNCNLHQKTL